MQRVWPRIGKLLTGNVDVGVESFSVARNEKVKEKRRRIASEYSWRRIVRELNSGIKKGLVNSNENSSYF